MSSAEASPSHPGASLGVRDSAGYEWEEINHPSPTSEHAHLIPPPSTVSRPPLCPHNKSHCPAMAVGLGVCGYNRA